MMDGGVFREARHYGDYRPGRGNVTHGSPGAPQTYERCPFEKAKQVTIKLNQGGSLWKLIVKEQIQRCGFHLAIRLQSPIPCILLSLLQ